MEWTVLIEKNFANILSALSLIAIIMIYFFTLSDRRKSRKLELQHKQLESKKQYHDQQLAAPIIRFIDEELRLMTDWYWSMMDGTLEKEREKKEEEELLDHREQQGGIRARVASFRDDELSTAFKAFSSIWGQFRHHIADKNPLEAYEEMEKAWEIAGTILGRMGFQIPEH